MRRITRAPRMLSLVAAASLLLAACGGDDGDTAAADPGDGTIQIEAGDIYFDPENLSAPAGEVEFTVTNVGEVEHDLVIEELGDELIVHVDPGETATRTIDLEAGTYTVYCSIPGHRATMEGTLTVS